jgi:hypothetical protein
MFSSFALPKSVGLVVCAGLVTLANGGDRTASAADPYPRTPDRSTIQFALSADAPIGTLTVHVGRQNLEAWEQPAYPGGRPTFTLFPGKYPVEFAGDPTLHMVDARPQAITVVNVGRSNRSYRILSQEKVRPDQLQAAHQGAAPLSELGSVISFKIRPQETPASR